MGEHIEQVRDMPPSSDSSEERLTISRIAVPKAHDVLAAHLRERILQGDIQEGETLPSERELVEQTGLSRNAVREALRTLSGEGLIQTRHGRFGGSVVTLPGQDTIASTVQRFVQGRKIPLKRLLETRILLEPYLARLAATRRTDVQADQLESLHAELVGNVEDFKAFSLSNIRWHNAIAHASDNELLEAFHFSLSSYLHTATMEEGYDAMETRQAIIKIHGCVTDAIIQKNPDEAERSMRAHMIGAMEIQRSK